VARVGSHRIHHAARLLHLQLRSSELVAIQTARESGLCQRGALLLPLLGIGFSLLLEHARVLSRKLSHLRADAIVDRTRQPSTQRPSCKTIRTTQRQRRLILAAG
jgi:hypothetical protein